MVIHLKKTVLAFLPFAIAITFCPAVANENPDNDVMLAASECDNVKAEACHVILPIARANCPVGNTQACWIVINLHNRGITQGDLQKVADRTRIVGVWGTSSTPIYGGGPSYGLSYAFNPDGTYIVSSSFGTQRGNYTVSGSTVLLVGTDPPRPPKRWAWGFGNNGYGRTFLRLITENGPLELYPRN
jgi:hypothetical protein